MSSQMARAAASSIWVYFSRAAQLVLGFLLSVLLVRILSHQDYGSYQMIMTLQTFFVYILALGVDAALVRYVPEFIELKQFGNVNRVIKILVGFRIGTTLVVVLGLYAMSGKLIEFFNMSPEMKGSFGLVLVFIFLSRVQEVMGPSVLNAYMEQKELSLTQIGKTGLKIAIFTGLASLNNWGYRAILWALLLTELAATLVYGVMLMRKLKVNNQLEVNSGKLSLSVDLKRIQKFALFSGLLASTAFLQEIMVDNFVIAHYMSIVDVGLYGFAATIVGIVNMFNPGIVLKGIFSYLLVRKYTETKNADYLVQGNSLVIKLSAFVNFPLFCCLFLFLREIIMYVYDPKYLPAVLVIQILLAFMMVNTFTYGFGHILFVLEKVHYRLFVLLFAVYNLIMDLILIPRYGLNGAAVATGTSILITYIYFLVAIRYFIKINISFPWGGIFKMFVNTAIMGAISYFLFSGQIDNLAVLVMALLGSAAFYFAASYLNKPFSDVDRGYINRAFGRKIWVF